MANELKFAGNPATDSGLTVTAKVYNDVFVQVGGDVSCTEVGVLAAYLGDMPEVSPGVLPAKGIYYIRFFSGALLLEHGAIAWDGSQEITIIPVFDRAFIASKNSH